MTGRSGSGMYVLCMWEQGRAGRDGETHKWRLVRAFVQVCTVRIWRYRIKEIQIRKKRYRRIEPWIRYI